MDTMRVSLIIYLMLEVEYDLRIKEELRNQEMHLDAPLYIGDDSSEEDEILLDQDSYAIEVEIYRTLTAKELET